MRQVLPHKVVAGRFCQAGMVGLCAGRFCLALFGGRFCHQDLLLAGVALKKYTPEWGGCAKAGPRRRGFLGVYGFPQHQTLRAENKKGNWFSLVFWCCSVLLVPVAAPVFGRTAQSPFASAFSPCLVLLLTRVLTSCWYCACGSRLFGSTRMDQTFAVTAGALMHLQSGRLGNETVMSHAPAWSQVLELEYQIRHRAYKRASRKKASLKQASEDARTDLKLLQEFFYGLASLEACAAAAREVLASASATSSSSQNLSYVDTSGVEPPPKKVKTGKEKGGKTGKGGKEGKGGKVPKAGPKPAPNAQPKAKAATAKGAKRKLALLCMPGGKCIKFNLGSCSVKKFKYAHECAVCGKEECAAYWHDE